jgi:hypothetical protein
MLAVAWTSTAFAWGPQGHRVIARVAEGRLSPAAKAAIGELLIPPDTLPDVADWADREGHDAAPGSARWHFINVPIGDARFDPRLIRDDNNVVVKIKQYRRVLSDRSRPKKERQRALLFFVHLVSDIHQPLHVGDHDDHGGNDTQIRFFDEGTNLHRLWGFRPDPPDRRRRPGLGLPGRAGDHVRGDRGVVQGIGRRLGRREPAGRQARLPPARRCPQDHPPRLQAGRVLPRASGADPQETDGEGFRPPAE